nr:uncharacterized protein LOC127328267 [Lolium perenne]
MDQFVLRGDVAVAKRVNRQSVCDLCCVQPDRLKTRNQQGAASWQLKHLFPSTGAPSDLLPFVHGTWAGEGSKQPNKKEKRNGTYKSTRCSPETRATSPLLLPPVRYAAADAVGDAGQGGAQVGARQRAGRAAGPAALRRHVRRQRELAPRHGRRRRVERAHHALQLGGLRHAGLVRLRGPRRQGLRRLRAGILLQRHRRRGRHHLHARQGRLRRPHQGEQHERRRLPRAREAAVRALLHQEDVAWRHRRASPRRVPHQGVLQWRGVRHAAEDSESRGWRSC